MKLCIFALSTGIAAQALLCSAAWCAPQSRDALIVGITDEWKTNANVDSEAKAAGGITSNDDGLGSLGFLKTIKDVNEKTCFYGTGGYVTLQFGDEVVPLICKPGEDALDCGQKAKARMTKPVMCSRHVQAPATEAHGSITLDATFPFFHIKGAAERYITPVSRGLDPELKDAVVQLQDGKLDLTPAFDELESGNYKVRIEPLNGSGAAGVVTAEVRWPEGGKALGAVPGMTTGLYRIRRLAGNGSVTGQDGWIAVCGPGEFAEKSHAYGAALEATRKWPPEVDARAPQAVLRAYLDALSRGPVKVTHR